MLRSGWRGRPFLLKRLRFFSSGFLTSSYLSSFCFLRALKTSFRCSGCSATHSSFFLLTFSNSDLNSESLELSLAERSDKPWRVSISPSISVGRRYWLSLCKNIRVNLPLVSFLTNAKSRALERSVLFYYKSIPVSHIWMIEILLKLAFFNSFFRCALPEEPCKCLPDLLGWDGLTIRVCRICRLAFSH